MLVVLDKQYGLDAFRLCIHFPIAPSAMCRSGRKLLLFTHKLRYYQTMRPGKRTDELDKFKSEINLCEYASSRGFELDRKKSSRSSATMRHANGDKLIVARGANRHWKYFNVHDARDKGTIIDFVQLRDRGTLGDVRKELRPWVGRGGEIISAPRRQFVELAPNQHDAARVLTAWKKCRPINGLHEYLEKVRKIPRSVLTDPIFEDRIFIDGRRNAVFPHYIADGLSGFEIKNQGFTGFSPGGVKGLFMSQPQSDDNSLVICETAIDALSYAAIFGTKQKRFVSTAGQISPAQAVHLQSAVEKMPDGSSIILAMDNDKAGRQLAGKLTETLSQAAGTAKTIVVRLPDDEGDDWNDFLRRSRKIARPTLAFG